MVAVNMLSMLVSPWAKIRQSFLVIDFVEVYDLPLIKDTN